MNKNQDKKNGANMLHILVVILIKVMYTNENERMSVEITTRFGQFTCLIVNIKVWDKRCYSS